MANYYIHIVILLIALSAKEEWNITNLLSNPNYKVVKVIRKNESIYTQGLFISNDSQYLFESGGLYKESVLIQYFYPYIIKEREIKLESKYFAEGIALCFSKADNQLVLFQLTYREKVILKYAYPSMKYIGLIPMDERLKEGWGLSSYANSNELIATDGSDIIFILSCDNDLAVVKTIKVTYDINPNETIALDRLNDLIYVNGSIYANRYFDFGIYKVNPQNGKVLMQYDMTGLAVHEISHFKLTNTRLSIGDVLNGIAYDYNSNTFIFTGKKWSNYYLVKFLH